MDGPGSANAGAAPATTTTVGAAARPGTSSPVSARNGTAGGGGSNGGGAGHIGHAKRKRSGVDFESSPGSAGEVENENEHEHEHEHEVEEDDGSERRRQPGVKRACNECRQQKLRCDVVQDPFTTCSRCTRLKLECKIESNFKRVGKRSKHAEMEKQIERLRRTLQRAQAQGYTVEDEEDIESPITNGMYSNVPAKSQFMGSEEAVSSLLHLKQSGSYNIPRITHTLEDVSLTQDAVDQLYRDFFSCYHPWLPFLDPHQTPEQFFLQSPLLFWTIISVAARRTRLLENLVMSLTGPLSRLLWTTVGGVPASHHAVKALCLLCTWPLPTSTTATDPTHILCGVMMKIATGIGLHRPNHAQDFSRVSVDFNQDELHDRVITWAVCNIVAQSVGTGYGQPASSLYDWTLAVRTNSSGPFSLSAELDARLQIEKYCDKVSKEMYSNASDSIGLSGDELRAMLTRLFRRDHNDLQALVSREAVSPLIEMYVKAAGLHLRLAAFFDSHTTPGYMEDLNGLWRATIAFLDCLFALNYPNISGDNVLQYGTNYVCQMIVAAGFALLKLLGSFYSTEIDIERGRHLFHRTIAAVRTMSVTNNDLSWRLAELMVQMYNGMRIETKSHTGPVRNVDSSLQLKVRCRHSMSLVFDSIWRWREDFQASGRGNLEAVFKNQTNPDSAAESRASSTQLDATLVPAASTLHNGLQTQLNGITGLGTNMSSGLSGGYPDSNYEVFDPLNWMLDGLVDFPYSYAAVQGLETQGMN